MLLTNEPYSSFGEELSALLQSAKHVRIATGYIGLTIFQSVETQLRAIVSGGGTVKIIVGLGYFEGLSQLMINALKDFDDYCDRWPSESGVMACTEKRFHGKLYLIENQSGERVASVGSSNFSSTGFGDWWEGNFVTRDETALRDISAYIDRLQLNNAHSIKRVVFPVKGRKREPGKGVRGGQKRKARFYDGVIPPELSDPAFTIPVRVTEASNLNLYLSKGRKNKTGIFKIRPWYEVEMTVRREDISENLLGYLPNQVDPWIFTLVTKDGHCYEAKFKRKSASRTDPRTLHELPLDFMTAPREDLGRIIKGKLGEMGLLSFGEPITEEILAEAEMPALSFFELETGVFLIDL